MPELRAQADGAPGGPRLLGLRKGVEGASVPATQPEREGALVTRLLRAQPPRRYTQPPSQPAAIGPLGLQGSGSRKPSFAVRGPAGESFGFGSHKVVRWWAAHVREAKRRRDKDGAAGSGWSAHRVLARGWIGISHLPPRKSNASSGSRCRPRCRARLLAPARRQSVANRPAGSHTSGGAPGNRAAASGRSRASRIEG